MTNLKTEAPKTDSRKKAEIRVSNSAWSRQFNHGFIRICHNFQRRLRFSLSLRERAGVRGKGAFRNQDRFLLPTRFLAKTTNFDISSYCGNFEFVSNFGFRASDLGALER